jgi:hypothetical protein
MNLLLEGCSAVSLGAVFLDPNAVPSVSSRLPEPTGVLLRCGFQPATGGGLFTIERSTAIRQVPFLPHGAGVLEEAARFPDC